MIEFPEKLQPLFSPCRYKVLYGGRGAAKSWGIARALLILGSAKPLRVLCAREVQRTIADSVHRLLEDQATAVGLESFYRVQESSISGRNGTEFLFAGLRQQSIDGIKSFEGVDIVWVEEAHVVTKRSWNILIPTIRKDGSEIWVSFNPELDTDETYQRFVVRPPEGAWVQKLTYRDNPWFPGVLEAERLHLKRIDPDAYENVWEGSPRTVVEGAIYAREVIKMIEDRRVRPVPYDPHLPVHTVWDLGWNDQNSIILLQRLHSEVRVIEYLEASFVSIPEWVAELQKRRYVWGTDYLPHDGNQTRGQTGRTDADVVRKFGRKVVVIPRQDVEVGIRAARSLFPRVYIDEVKGVGLVDALKRYKRALPATTGEPGNPVHDSASHGADAFRALATIVDQIRNEGDRPRTPPQVPYVPHDTAVGM